MKVLIVEDEVKTAASLRAFLEEECQAEVDCAFDGRTGREMACQNHYDVILTDVVMPYINGIELCRQLRELGLKVPILVLSARYQPEDKVAGLNAGADDYLSKPFDFLELAEEENSRQHSRLEALPVVQGTARVYCAHIHGAPGFHHGIGQEAVRIDDLFIGFAVEQTGGGFRAPVVHIVVAQGHVHGVVGLVGDRAEQAVLEDVPGNYFAFFLYQQAG